MASVYLPYIKEVPTPVFKNQIEKNKGASIASLDAHHSLWGNSNNNQRGEFLLVFIFSYDLEILNRGKEATFVNRLRAKVIDITLCMLHEA